MMIHSHKLVGVPFLAAQAAGGKLAEPTLVVAHDTAGRLDKGNSISWFCDPNCNVSAHIVVERDGSITQMVAFNTVAFHAGKSSWKGRSGCNSFAIGIEIVNPGALDAQGRAWFHKKSEAGFPVSELRRVKTREHGDHYWMPYTDAQIAAVKELCHALVKGYPSITEIVGHFHISPGRKIDVNPLFPIDEVRVAAFAADVEVEKPALESMAPAVVKPQGVVKTAYQSRSVWAQVTGLIAMVGGVLTDYLRDAFDWLMWGIGIVPDIYAETKDTLSSTQEMAAWFNVNWKSISLTVALVCVAVALIRHVADKRALANGNPNPPA